MLGPFWSLERTHRLFLALRQAFDDLIWCFYIFEANTRSLLVAISNAYWPPPDLTKGIRLATVLHDRFPCFIFRDLSFLVLFIFRFRHGGSMVHWEHLKRICGTSAFLFIVGLCVRLAMPFLFFVSVSLATLRVTGVRFLESFTL